MNINEFIYKTDSPQLAAYFEQFGKESYISAEEINTIVDTLKLMSENVSSSGFIEKKVHGFYGQDYKIAAFFKWAIENELYSNLVEVSLSVPYAADGKTRYERITATTDNTFVRIVGTESSSAALLPDLPENTIELTRYIVRDDSIDAPEPVVPLTNFVEKATYTPQTITSEGTVGSFEMDKRSALKASGALIELGNVIKNNSTHFYPGQLFLFIDATPDGNVKLPHMYTGGGSGSIAWFHPDELDYYTDKNELVLFALDFVGSQKVYKRISYRLKNKSVTVEKLQEIPYGTFFARNTAGVGQPDVLDVFAVLELLDLQDVVYDLSKKINIPRIVSASTTALKNETIHVTANATILDFASPVAGDFYNVNVISGIAIIDSKSYNVGIRIFRSYDGTAWKSEIRYENTYLQNNGFDFTFDKPGTFTGAAINGGNVSTSPKAPVNKFSPNGFTIRGNASNVDSGYKYYILNDRPFFVGNVLFFVVKPERLTNTFLRFGLQVNEAFTPLVDSGNMACIEITNNQLVAKTALGGLTTTSSPTLTLVDTNWLFVKVTLENTTLCRFIVKNTFGGAELYNKALTSNIPHSSENAGLYNQTRFILAGTSSISSSADLYQQSRICHFQEEPNWLKQF